MESDSLKEEGVGNPKKGHRTKKTHRSLLMIPRVNPNSSVSCIRCLRGTRLLQHYTKMDNSKRQVRLVKARPLHLVMQEPISGSRQQVGQTLKPPPSLNT